MAETKPNGVPGVVLGAYRVAAWTGLLTGLASGDYVLGIRWASAAYKMAIQRLSIITQVVTPFTAAQEVNFHAYVARSFTVSDTGGVPVDVSGGSNRLHALMGTSQIPAADARLATVSTLTAGTRTLDATPFLRSFSNQMLAAASAAPTYGQGTFESNQASRYPLILSQNEGIVVLASPAFGAGGTVRAQFEIEWLEFSPNPS